MAAGAEESGPSDEGPLAGALTPSPAAERRQVAMLAAMLQHHVPPPRPSPPMHTIQAAAAVPGTMGEPAILTALEAPSAASPLLASPAGPRPGRDPGTAVRHLAGGAPGTDSGGGAQALARGRDGGRGTRCRHARAARGARARRRPGDVRAAPGAGRLDAPDPLDTIEQLEAIEPEAGITFRRDPIEPPLLDHQRWIEWVLSVTLNGREMPEGILFIEEPRTGRLAVELSIAQAWRLRIDPDRVLTFDGVPFMPLDAIPDILSRLDEAALVLELEIPPRASSTRASTSTSGGGCRPHPAPGPFSTTTS
jgi:hypothetical protein